jgi:hypothetical protein
MKDIGSKIFNMDKA